MKIAVLHDYADVLRRTRAYPRLKDHEVIIHTDAYTDPARVIAPAARYNVANPEAVGKR